MDLAIVVSLFFLYMAPLMVALMRRHASAGGVAVINLFLGWTVLGWILALAWAASGRHGDD